MPKEKDSYLKAPDESICTIAYLDEAQGRKSKSGMLWNQ